MTEDLAAFMTDLTLNIEEQEEDINAVEANIETDIEFQHLLISRDELFKVLKVIGPIVNLKSTRNIPKALTLFWENDTLKYLITDDLAYFTKEVHLLNKENVLKETLCIPLNILQAAIKSFANNILIYKNENNYYIRLLTGDLILDLVTPEEALLKRPGNIGEELMYTSASSLGDALKVVLPIVSCETIPEKRKLTFINNEIEFNTGKFLISYKIEIPDMKISYKTAEFLKGMCSLYEGAVYFYKDKSIVNRIHIKCQGIEYTTSIGVESLNNNIGNFIDKRTVESGIWVNKNQLDSIVTLASNLNYAVGNIIFKFNGEDINIEIPNTRGTSTFKVSKESGTLLKENSNKVMVLSKSFKKLLNSFGSSTVYIILNEDSVTLISGAITGVLLK